MDVEEIQQTPQGKRYCHDEALRFTDGTGIAIMPLERTALWLYLHSPFESEPEDRPGCFRIKDVLLHIHLFIPAVAI